MKVIIIGGGACGASCATRLRRLDENCEITILERTNEVSIANCGLPYYCSSVISEREKILISNPERFKNMFNINVQLNCEVIEINRNEKYPPLSPEILRKINKLVEQYDKTQQVEKDSKVLSITDGTKLVREFKSRRYTVLVLQDGYEFNGSKYKSLSAVANKITGTRWNGKKFFGVA